MSGDDDLIPNPYRAAIAQQRDRAEPFTQDLREALKDAITAMDNNAWVSSVADTFYSELVAHSGTLDTAADRAIEEFNTTIEGMPTEVSPNSSYAHWRNL